jgi:mono/diheme cytochrome c family protein
MARTRSRDSRAPRGCPARRPGLLSLLAILAVLAATRAFADAETDYMLNCRGCHGPDGAGAPGAAPSFRGQLGRFLTVPGGREYLIRVPGTAQSELDDARTAALLNWLVRAFSAEEVPADFAPYTAAEVGPARRRPLLDVWAARRALLDAIAARAAQGAPP